MSFTSVDTSRENSPSESLFKTAQTVSAKGSNTANKITPLMQQYWEIKREHTDKILLFRMGDFYEMFHDDAKVAAPILNIALTSRNKKAEDETPMCGVPHHSIAGPIGKLLAAGHKVAICDQLEDPAEAKGIVKRGVTRVLSPGMVYEPESLAELKSNYVAAYDEVTVSFLEASTGECFFYRTRDQKEKNEVLSRMVPAEIILTRSQMAEFFGVNFEAHVSEFDLVESSWPERFQNIPDSAKRLLTYATHMQGVKVLSILKEFEERNLSEHMILGANVIRHLEVFQSYRADDRGSLFHSINRTKTSAGARELKSWLQLPLIKKDKIEDRQNNVEEWTRKPLDLKLLRQTLGQMGDIERRLAKVAYANCHVRDLLALAQSLRVGLAVSPFCANVQPADIQVAEELVQKIEATLVEDAPLNMKAGGFIRIGVSAELDELIELAENSQKRLLDLESREREATQISSLKVRYNNVFGYYIEVTNAHKDKVPDHYKRKQTLTNAERYVTQELNELESKILSGREKRVQLEDVIFQNLRDQVLKLGPRILLLAQKWSELDVVSSLAWLALEQKYVRPLFSQEAELYLEGSRHPVVEQEVKRTFVPNTIRLSFGECLLLTGPNMAGKSTLMRQVAVTSLLAQIGSFVPANAARLPIFEQIFTRIGASDSLSEGLSTFMVEMKETAEMLGGAGPKTLVVLDEVGRGTSTYDGMSLAQAILEYLVQEAKSMTLFATHYHEITRLADVHDSIHNAHMSVQERGHEIHFLYTLQLGPANKSYGIQVARLAGLPERVVTRANQLLSTHEEKTGEMIKADPSIGPDSLAEFNHSVRNYSLDDRSYDLAMALIEQIKTFSTLEASPLQALNQIAKWQQDLS